MAGRLGQWPLSGERSQRSKPFGCELDSCCGILSGLPVEKDGQIFSTCRIVSHSENVKRG